MKTLNIICFSLFLTSFTVFSQGFGQNSYGGSNRNMYRGNTQSHKPSAEEIEKNKDEQLDKFMNKLKTELTLDELQFIAIKNEVVSNQKSIDIILKKETSEEDKANDIKALTEKLDKNVNSYLNPAQKEKYKVFIENLKNNKKPERKNKKGDKKPEE